MTYNEIENTLVWRVCYDYIGLIVTVHCETIPGVASYIGIPVSFLILYISFLLSGDIL